jgi:hypothetical protein
MSTIQHAPEGEAASLLPAKPLSRHARSSYLIYLGLLAFLVAVKLILTFAPVSFINSAQAAAFAWPSLILVGAAGLLGIFLSTRCGFPDWWDARISAKGRLLWPACIGMGAGVLFLVVERLTNFEQIALVNTGQASINVPLPASLYFYPAGAIITEILYRLAPLPLLLWLISNVALRHHFQARVFWVLAVLLSLIEPASQVAVFQGHAGVMVILFAAIFAINLLEVWLFRTYGFLAPLTMRLAYYLVWLSLAARSPSERSRLHETPHGR